MFDTKSRYSSETKSVVHYENFGRYKFGRLKTQWYLTAILYGVLLTYITALLRYGSNQMLRHSIYLSESFTMVKLKRCNNSKITDLLLHTTFFGKLRNSKTLFACYRFPIDGLSAPWVATLIDLGRAVINPKPLLIGVVRLDPADRLTDGACVLSHTTGATMMLFWTLFRFSVPNCFPQHLREQEGQSPLGSVLLGAARPPILRVLIIIIPLLVLPIVIRLGFLHEWRHVL